MTLALSVGLMPKGPVAEVADLAILAEGLGYRRCWVYDEGLVTRDVYVTLTAIALATERILLGPGITNPYVRHPGVTAAAVATLDELSGGRAFVGLGAGGGLTLDPLGINRRRPVAALGDMVGALRDLFEGRTVDLEGEVFSFRSASLGYGRPAIEVFLAGRGPLVTRLGGEVADGLANVAGLVATAAVRLRRPSACRCGQVLGARARGPRRARRCTRPQNAFPSPRGGRWLRGPRNDRREWPSSPPR